MIALDRPKTREPDGGRVLLRGVSWETYERLLDEHDESAGPRFTCDDGFLEIMALSLEHEDPERILASLVELVLCEWDVDFLSAGSNTFKSAKLKKGFEPDTSFYIENADVIRGKTRLDLAVDPPPDLVIAVQVTEPLLPRLPIFASMCVPEIWCYDSEMVRILRFERGDYREVEQSAALSPLTAGVITDFLRCSSRSKRPAWMRAVREWAQAQRR